MLEAAVLLALERELGFALFDRSFPAVCCPLYPRTVHVFPPETQS